MTLTVSKFTMKNILVFLQMHKDFLITLHNVRKLAWKWVDWCAYMWKKPRAVRRILFVNITKKKKRSEPKEMPHRYSTG
jgi:hypothetical protein